jgi:hypothetical protein
MAYIRLVPLWRASLTTPNEPVPTSFFSESRRNSNSVMSVKYFLSIRFIILIISLGRNFYKNDSEKLKCSIQYRLKSNKQLILYELMLVDSKFLRKRGSDQTSVIDV